MSAQMTPFWLKSGAIRALLASALLAAPVAYGMVEIEDADLSRIEGQALFLADKIVGDTTDATTYNDFTFYRIAMDADIAMNMSIDKLQLGCGGFNEGILGDACDIDIDFATFMGTTGPGSDFLMERPYIEIAVKNDGDPTRREVVGIKIGAAAAEGVLGVGRLYATGETNQEFGGTCGNSSQPVSGAAGRLNCHSGANTMSGYIRAELSATGFVDAGWLVGSGDVCFGYTRNDQRGPDPCNAGNAYYTSVRGTRMQRLIITQAPLKIYDGSGLLGAFTGAFVDIKANLRMLHEFAFDKNLSRDFFIAFQRERVAYPIFDQSQPYQADGIGGASDLYSAYTNTGWWMNLTYAAVTDLDAGNLELGIGDALDALAEGANLLNLNLGQTPPDNCFGSAKFC